MSKRKAIYTSDELQMARATSEVVIVSYHKLQQEDNSTDIMNEAQLVAKINLEKFGKIERKILEDLKNKEVDPTRDFVTAIQVVLCNKVHHLTLVYENLDYNEAIKMGSEFKKNVSVEVQQQKVFRK